MTEFHHPTDNSGPSRAVWDAILHRGGDLYAEYARQPVGAHSPDLQFVLQHFRKAPCAGKYVLVAITPHKTWVLGTLTGTRRDPVVVHDNITFDSLAEAERYVFRQRWIELTGLDPAKET